MGNRKDKKQTIFKEEHTDHTDSLKTMSGLKENIAGALCYVTWAISGVIFLIIEKENKFIRFHALQSIMTTVTLFIVFFMVMFIPFIGGVLSALLSLIVFIFWLFMMWKAYQGAWFKIPIIGEQAEKWLKNDEG